MVIGCGRGEGSEVDDDVGAAAGGAYQLRQYLGQLLGVDGGVEHDASHLVAARDLGVTIFFS